MVFEAVFSNINVLTQNSARAELPEFSLAVLRIIGVIPAPAHS
jgi:hypothetical protein